jgi:hypothetical protein
MTLDGRIAVLAIGAGVIDPGETDFGVSSMMPPLCGNCLEPEHPARTTVNESAENKKERKLITDTPRRLATVRVAPESFRAEDVSPAPKGSDQTLPQHRARSLGSCHRREDA